MVRYLIFALDDVSILARAEARALPDEARKAEKANVFQSSPAPRRGRYALGATAGAELGQVSILARAEARALLEQGWEKEPRVICFNPRPRRGAGATCAHYARTATSN